MIELRSGNMFLEDARIRVNTVNTVGVMGKGVALAFKKRYPEMFKAYVSACRMKDIAPGKMHIWKNILFDEVIVNFPTKRHWKDNSLLQDIEDGLYAFRIFLEGQPPSTVALPALGCGNGGLQWSKVLSLIVQYLEDLDHRILVFQPQDSRDLINM